MSAPSCWFLAGGSPRPARGSSSLAVRAEGAVAAGCLGRQAWSAALAVRQLGDLSGTGMGEGGTTHHDASAKSYVSLSSFLPERLWL